MLEPQPKLCQCDDHNTVTNVQGYSLLLIEYYGLLCKEKN